MKIKTKIAALLLLVLGLTSCETGFEDNKENQEINQWTYDVMTDIYLWNNLIREDISSFSNSDPIAFFNATKFYYDDTQYDKWSVMHPDSAVWQKILAGNSASTGLHLLPKTYNDGYNIYAVVLYVEKGSTAESAGLKRGDLIVEANGEVPNLQNYVSVLYGDGPFEYVTGQLQELDAGGFTIVKDDTTVSVARTEFQVNPIFTHKIIEENGTKIGYLVYNNFIRNRETPIENDPFLLELNQVFKTFKDAQVDELILDLRYNQGGDMETAIHLASLLVPDIHQQDLMVNIEWNSAIQKMYEDSVEHNPAIQTNLSRDFKQVDESINLSRIYVITTNNTASASELVINSLLPYMDVITVGENTSGKFVGSVTVTDPDKKHAWALQPIVMKTANAAGKTDFWDGLPATHAADDDYEHALGDLEENMLKTTVGIITDQPAKKQHVKNWGKPLPIPAVRPGMFLTKP